MHLSGQYEGKVIIYEENKYPYDCIGPVRYLWKALNNTDTVENRMLWLWSHPSMFNQIKTQLFQIFNLKVEKDSSEPPESKKAKFENNLVINDGLEFKNDKVIIKCLKDKLVRFKLLGPLSTTILSFALKIEDFSKLVGNVKWSNNTELTK